MRTNELREIGRPGLKATALGFGTAPLGGLYATVSDADAEATLDTAWDVGIRLFDTAPQYGNGVSEQRLGSFLQGKPRDSFVLATKVGRLLREPHGGPVPDDFYKSAYDLRPVFDFSYDGVMRSVEESLTRLGLDRVDILHIHDPDNHFDAAIAGAYVALDQLRADGTVSAVGAGMNQSRMLYDFAQAGDFDCFLLAGRYSLLDQSGMEDLLPLAASKGISILAGGVYNSGILADPDGQAKFNYQDAPHELIEKARALRDVCQNHGVDLKAAAMQFPTGHAAVTHVLTGARTADELAENAAMYSADIPVALWSDLRASGLVAESVPLPGAA